VAVWWTGDLLGALVAAPLLLAWVLQPAGGGSARGSLEVALLCLGTALAAELGLGHLLAVPALLRRLDYLYLLFPFVVWAATRFGSRGASLMTFTVATVAVARTVQGGGPFNVSTGGGTLFAVACYLLVVAVTGLLLAAVTTHERETATAALQRREDELRMALDAAQMGVWHWSAAENRLTWDDTLRRIYGLAPGHPISGYEDFIGRVHADDRERVETTVRRALVEGGRLDYEFRIVLPDGRVRWIADRGRVVLDERGAVAAMTGTCQDVSERRATEERLRQADRMESVGRLAGGVAHEANNQMSVVIGAADFILKRQDIPPAVRADTESIRAAAVRTSAVTAQLLAFSRRQVLRPQVIGLREVVEKFRPVLERTLGEDCTLALRLGDGPGRVRADPGQLEQVLLNLTLNARDAMPRGGTLTLETGVAELTEGSVFDSHGVSVRSGRYALLAVTDTGHGMAPDTLSQIFEPLFTTKGVGRGTGLGLATVYGIVKQSEGYIWAYSEPNRGTTFKIYLPLVAQPSEPGPGAEPAVSGGAGEVVLVVEDDAMVRAIAARALTETGHRVIEADSGAQAIALLRGLAERPALVLTDLVMPGMSGIELAAEVARLAPGTPVLFVSGYTDSEIVRRGLVEPDALLVTKPFSPEGLVRAVRGRINDSALRR
jgi:PAS domain S-box-containing protein